MLCSISAVDSWIEWVSFLGRCLDANIFIRFSLFSVSPHLLWKFSVKSFVCVVVQEICAEHHRHNTIDFRLDGAEYVRARRRPKFTNFFFVWATEEHFIVFSFMHHSLTGKKSSLYGRIIGNVIAELFMAFVIFQNTRSHNS